jgi:hypothetical protein
VNINRKCIELKDLRDKRCKQLMIHYKETTGQVDKVTKQLEAQSVICCTMQGAKVEKQLQQHPKKIKS